MTTTTTMMKMITATEPNMDKTTPMPLFQTALGSSKPANTGGHELFVPVLTDATVMMVDDEPTTLAVVQTYLEDAGYTSFISTTQPKETFALLESERPDILLLDLMMPEVSGFDILARMQADPLLRYLPVIVLTSASDATTKLKALELGATDFLAKPVDPSELALRVRNTLAFKEYQDRLAFSDALTGLPNRAAFLVRLETALRSGRQRNMNSALLYIDVDRFKQINDTLGHNAGDALLRGVAHRLQHSLRESDIVGRIDEHESENSVSRIGGDEFVALLPSLVSADDVGSVARRLLKAVAQPFQIGGRELFVTCSVGIAISPEDSSDAEGLLKHADVAMGHAKGQGKNTYAFYNPALNVRALERLTLQSEMHKALERGEFVLYFQPKMDIASGSIIGAEALVRWNHPERGLVGPDMFIGLAEESGLIVALGTWALRETCKYTKAWQWAGFDRLRVSVNVSGVQFRQPDFASVVRAALDAASLGPECLILELTESIIMNDSKEHVEMLRAVRAMGLKLSVDDFGTGYSSLSYLKNFPVDEIKIDRSFVSGLPEEKESAAIVRAILTLASGLGFMVVAEGVETNAQLAFLRVEGCDQYQGYRFSKPVPAAAFEKLLRPAAAAA